MDFVQKKVLSSSFFCIARKTLERRRTSQESESKKFSVPLLKKKFKEAQRFGFLPLELSLTHPHEHTHARTHTNTHARTCTRTFSSIQLPKVLFESKVSLSYLLLAFSRTQKSQKLGEAAMHQFLSLSLSHTHTNMHTQTHTRTHTHTNTHTHTLSPAVTLLVVASDAALTFDQKLFLSKSIFFPNYQIQFLSKYFILCIVLVPMGYPSCRLIDD